MTRFQKLLGKNLAQNNLEAIEWLEEKYLEDIKCQIFNYSFSNKSIIPKCTRHNVWVKRYMR
jgi:hypothetical protein